MLLTLSIRNLATIESLDVEFTPGLNVLTGETGAGKSILVGALGLVLGARASGEAIRPGHKLATVEAAFNPLRGDMLQKFFAGDLSIDWEPGQSLLLRREITLTGRNRCFIEGQMIGASDLKRIGEILVDFHGQHEHQSLFRAAAARTALDAFAGHAELLTDYESVWQEWADLKKRKLASDTAAENFRQRSDFLQYQVDEFEQVNPKQDEIRQLEQEEARLANADLLSRSAVEAHGILQGGTGDSQPSLSRLLREVEKRLKEIGLVDEHFNTLLPQLAEQRALFEDLALQLHDYTDTIESDPARLNAVISRLEAIRRLVHKHGGTEDALFTTIQKMRDEIEHHGGDDHNRDEIDKAIESAAAQVRRIAVRLSDGRMKHATRLDREVIRRLRALNMEQAQFTTRVTPLNEPGTNGMDKAEFMLAANPGLPPAPLRKIGSGGEISRVMLSLKSVLASRDMIPTLVFDEIDVGLSGETALRVGKLMETLSESHQVLCVTHHAPIAARAENHLSVRKKSDKKGTFTGMRVLRGDERLEEIARMMSGEASTDAGIKLARQLMD